jgi:tetratricopeptide (TPR) repeat protein
MDKFEASNSEWCKGQLEDIEKRNADKRKKDKSAEASRVKGNKYFGMKKYDKALKEYAEALEKTPYKPNILTNMALTYAKLRQWDDAMEYCDRALHCDKGWTKALCRRAAVVVEQAKEEGSEGKIRLARVKALKDLERAKREVRGGGGEVG